MHVFVHGKKPCSTVANIAKVTTIEHRHIEAPYIEYIMRMCSNQRQFTLASHTCKVQRSKENNRAAMYYVHPMIIACLHDLITAATSSTATCVHSLAS